MKECKPEGGIQNLGAVLEFCLPQFRTLHRVLKLDFVCKEESQVFGWKFLSFHLFPSENFFRFIPGTSPQILNLICLALPIHQLQQPLKLSEVCAPFGIYFSASHSKGLPGRMPGLLSSTLRVHLMSLFFQRIQSSKAVQSCKIVASYVLFKFAGDFFS